MASLNRKRHDRGCRAMQRYQANGDPRKLKRARRLLAQAYSGSQREMTGAINALSEVVGQYGIGIAEAQRQMSQFAAWCAFADLGPLTGAELAPHNHK